MRDRVDHAVVSSRHVSLLGPVNKFWERKSAIRKMIESELRPRLVEELTPVIREQTEQDVRDRIRRDLEREAAEAAPGSRERKIFRDFVKEVEIDAHAQATVASASADDADGTLRRARAWRNPLAYFLLLAIGPMGYEAYLTRQSSPLFIFLTAMAALFLCYFAIASGVMYEDLRKKFREMRKVASDYLVVAERAKAFRMVHAERIETRKEMERALRDLSSEKEKLDRKYCPRVEDLHQARDSVRVRVEEPRFRVFEDFDERLEEAGEESRAAERGRA